jgi:hypothetical protein
VSYANVACVTGLSILVPSVLSNVFISQVDNRIYIRKGTKNM